MNHIKKSFWDMQDASTSSSSAAIILWMDAALCLVKLLSLADFQQRISIQNARCRALHLEMTGNSPNPFHSCSVSGLRFYIRGSLQFVFALQETADTCYLLSNKSYFC